MKKMFSHNHFFRANSNVPDHPKILSGTNDNIIKPSHFSLCIFYLAQNSVIPANLVQSIVQGARKIKEF